MTETFKVTTRNGDTVTIGRTDDGEWTYRATGKRLDVTGTASATGEWTHGNGVPLRYDDIPTETCKMRVEVTAYADEGSTINGIAFKAFGAWYARRTEGGDDLPDGAQSRWRGIAAALKDVILSDERTEGVARVASLSRMIENTEDKIKELNAANERLRKMISGG